jgi:hypothetical protein
MDTRFRQQQDTHRRCLGDGLDDRLVAQTVRVAAEMVLGRAPPAKVVSPRLGWLVSEALWALAQRRWLCCGLVGFVLARPATLAINWI